MGLALAGKTRFAFPQETARQTIGKTNLTKNKIIQFLRKSLHRQAGRSLAGPGANPSRAGRQSLARRACPLQSRAPIPRGPSANPSRAGRQSLAGRAPIPLASLGRSISGCHCNPLRILLGLPLHAPTSAKSNPALPHAEHCEQLNIRRQLLYKLIIGSFKPSTN